MQDYASAVETVGIVGASWSALFLAGGKRVQIYDPADDAETQTRDYIQRAWPALESLGLVLPVASPEHIQFSPSVAEAVSGALFVQQSVPERFPLKLDTYRSIESALAPEAIVATSSSGLLLRDLQTGWDDPGRFILGHPFNPPHLIPLVELLGNEHTIEGVLDRAAALYESCGKVTIRVRKEVPAHVANRLQAALWREAVHLVAEGVASVEDVDKAVTAGPGLRWSVMGPHMLFSLGSGGLGIDGFCERYRDSFHAWWQSLGTPTLDANTARLLAAGIAEEEHGRSFEQLAAERDTKLVAAMTALRRTAINLD